MADIRYFTIPNIITLLNLLCGSLAVVAAWQMGNMLLAFGFVALGAVFDFLDGFAARLLKRYSAMGIQLDSLADMVTFGFAPGAVLFSVIMKCAGFQADGGLPAPAFVALSVPLFSALRLARFNVDTEQKESFIGLPTPANALLITSLGVLIWERAETVSLWVPVALAVVCSYLLISPVRMFSFKFADFSWKHNALRYCFIAISIAGILLAGIAAIPAIVGLYIVVSTVTWVACKKRQ